MNVVVAVVTAVLLMVGAVPVDRPEQIAEQVVELTNRDRVAEGLPPLTLDGRLAAAAQSKVEDMLKREYFDHIDPDGHGPWDLLDSIGYDFLNVAENIARGLDDPERMQTGWMESPPHRKNILSPELTRIGVGAARTGPNAFHVVVLFARPSSR